DLGLTAADIQSAIVTDQYTDQPSGVTHIYMRQTFDGLPVVGAELAIHVMPDGRILSANSSFIPSIGETSAAAARPIGPSISPAFALDQAAKALGITATGTPVTGTLNGQTILTDNTLSLDPIPEDMKYFATAGGPRLAWDLVLRLPNHDGDWYN